MNAGRELDALIAEKIFGWRELQTDDSVLPIRLSGIAPEHETHRFTVPEYSIDITAAWEVVEKMKELYHSDRGFSLTYNLSTKQWQAGPFSAGDFGEDEYYFSSQACADTAPLAICLAALKAVGHIV